MKIARPSHLGLFFLLALFPCRNYGYMPWQRATRIDRSQLTPRQGHSDGLLSRTRPSRWRTCIMKPNSPKMQLNSIPIKTGYLSTFINDDDDKNDRLIPEGNPTADPNRESLSGVRYGSVLASLNVLFPPEDLEKRNAVSRTDGYWPFINNGKDPPKQFTYGEFDLYFFAELLDRSLDHYNNAKREEERLPTWDGKVFADIGSGTGRLVLAAAALHPGWQLCRGIEVLHGIHNVAVETLERCRDTESNGKVELKENDSEWRTFGSETGDVDWLIRLQEQLEGRQIDKLDETTLRQHDDLIAGQEPWVDNDLQEKGDIIEHGGKSQEYFLPLTSVQRVENEKEQRLHLAPIELSCGSFEDPYEYFGDVDLVFVFSSCMSSDMMASLGNAIGRQCKPGTIVITTEHVLPLEGMIEPIADDVAMPSGPFRLELLESVDGWCWLLGGQSTAHIHLVVQSIWNECIGKREKPAIPLETQAWRIVQAREAGELTDSKKFMRDVYNSMVFYDFPMEWRPNLLDD